MESWNGPTALYRAMTAMLTHRMGAHHRLAHITLRPATAFEKKKIELKIYTIFGELKQSKKGLLRQRTVTRQTIYAEVSCDFDISIQFVGIEYSPKRQSPVQRNAFLQIPQAQRTAAIRTMWPTVHPANRNWKIQSRQFWFSYLNPIEGFRPGVGRMKKKNGKKITKEPQQKKKKIKEIAMRHLNKSNKIVLCGRENLIMLWLELPTQFQL